jgi:CheY-like chemotaxis protein
MAVTAIKNVPAIVTSLSDRSATCDDGNVLLVEDDAAVRTYVAFQLRRFGYEVLEAEHGPEALDILQMNPSIDLLLTDVVLPKSISGIELALWVRQASPNMRVLLTSGYSDEALEAHGRPAEDMRLLRKPFRRKELAELLTQTMAA